jgi:hypothetical protein
MKKSQSVLCLVLLLLAGIAFADDTDLFTTHLAPNILLILDNSNSMDEDFLGNGVGSFHTNSKSVQGKKGLESLIDQFKDKLRFGLMTHKVSGLTSIYLHNSPYFVSYEPKSYCPNPPEECVRYAQTGNISARTLCASKCKADNPLFDVGYLDEIVTNYPAGTDQRNRYANLVYPKNQRRANPADPSRYMYYKHAYPMYSGSNLGTAFCYSGAYNANEDTPWDSYNCYTGKTGTGDDSTGYSGFLFGSELVPTDTDYALGYLDFGRRMNWYYAGNTWFSNTSPGDGYLHVGVDDLVDKSGKPTVSYTNLLDKLDPKENDEAGYMSCNKADKNTCSYIVNAGLTPTPGTLQTAIKYLKGEESYSTPIQAWCQKNFIVYVTDGLPSIDESGVPKSADVLMPEVLTKLDTLRDIKATIKGKSYNFDVKTYVLGVGLSDDAKPKLDQMAVHGGTDANGKAFYADNPQQLTDSLAAIFRHIIEHAYSFASPSVPSLRLVDNEVVYISSFTPNETAFWPGNLRAYTLEADGTLPVDGNGDPSNAPLWEASIPPSNDRVIKTVTGGVLKDFTTANVSPGDLGLKTAAERDGLVSYVRNLKLGDIFHSNSVVVGSPSSFFEDAGFNGPGQFYETNKNRTKVILVGANDGMLHAFNAATGVEQWAFVPNTLLKNLGLMKTAHTFYVDSSPRVADVWFYSTPTDTTKTKDEWRTVLICGSRKGGNTYFALDITNTLNPQFLWEFPKATDTVTRAKVGQSWSEPAIGRVKIEREGELYERWVAFLGAGYDSTEATGRGFFVIDIKTGDILWEYSFDPADVEKKFMLYPLAASPTMVDTNSDGYVNRVYIGDLGGQIWTFDVSSDPRTKRSNSLWSGKRLFKAPVSPAEKHPIYYAPAVAFDRYRVPWVYFGTGDRENPKDVHNQAERFYAVRDDGLGNSPRTEADLTEVTSLNTFTPDPLKKGWYIRLEKGGQQHEKVLAKPAVFNRLVYFTTFNYEESNDACAIGGEGRLYVVEYLSGGGALAVDELTDLQGTPSGRSKVIGTGVPSAPVISISVTGKASVFVGTTSGQIYSQEAFSPQTNKEMLYWREVIR